MDARKILEETVTSIFFGHGVVITPSFHMQKAVAESVLSLGLLDHKIMRNVSLEIIKDLLGGETNTDAKNEV
ncbi:MAG: hypothetical protein PHX08_10730 [Lachnospiraceae bacterium]|nr:hypothetical protein [Lachnospiraceae bacterium]